MVESPEMAALIEQGDFLAVTRRTAREAERVVPQWAEDALAACQGMDLLVAGIGGLYLGLALAEKLDLPLLQAYLVPFSPTRAFPSVLLPPSLPRLGGFLNRISHHLTRQVMWQGFRAANRIARSQVLDLHRAPFFGPYKNKRLQQLPILHAYSPAVLPKPPDWAANVHVTGYWFLDQAGDWTPPSELLDFLEQGPAPVYIGFGSMSQRDPEGTARLVVQALNEADLRAVISSGWGGLRSTDVPANVFTIDAIPHAWLFPRMKAVVHHGGAGTTAAGIRAGVPALVVPFFGDQFFWGQRIADLNVGPSPIPRKELTARRLAQALGDAVSDTTMRRRAAALGEIVRAESGVGRAVTIITEVAAY